MNQKINVMLAVFAILWVFQSMANAQVNRGTLVLVNMSPEKAIIAADSWASSEKAIHGKTVLQHENECKLTALDDKTVFAIAGYVGNGEPSTGGWRVQGVATRVRQELGANAPLEVITSRWTNIIEQMLRAEVARNPNAFSVKHRTPSGGVSDAIFVRSYPDSVSGFIVMFKYSPTALGRILSQTLPLTWENCPETPLGRYCALGESQTPLEFTHLMSPRARS